MKKVKNLKEDMAESGPGFKGKATAEKKAAALKLNREHKKKNPIKKSSGNPFAAVTHLGGKKKK